MADKKENAKRLREKFGARKGVLFGAAYGLYLPILLATAPNARDIALRLSMVGILCTAHTIFTELYLIGLERKVVKVPPHVQQEFEKLCHKLDLPPGIKLKVHNSDKASPVFSTWHETLYLSEKTINVTDPDERHFIMLHELVHIRRHFGLLNFYGLFVPVLDALALTGLEARDLVYNSTSGGEFVSNLLKTSASAAYMTLQTSLLMAFSRAREKVADLQALNITCNFKEAAEALLKLTPPGVIRDGGGIFSTHPGTWNRMAYLENFERGDGQAPQTEKIWAEFDDTGRIHLGPPGRAIG